MIVSILQDLMSPNKQEIIVGVKDNRSTTQCWAPIHLKLTMPQDNPWY